MIQYIYQIIWGEMNMNDAFISAGAVIIAATILERK